jgi:hypothetical protein
MWLKRYILLLILFIAIVLSDVYGDGCFVWNKGVDMNEPTQKVIIYWQNGKEVIILQVKYEGQTEDFAWIVPLPARPEVTAIDADKNPFAEISLYTQSRRHWDGKREPIISELSEESVTVLERKIVGVYDIAVLSAADPDALNKWLNNNGYAFPTERRNILEHYTKKNWVYVAMKIDPAALGKDEIKRLKFGELQPIRFAFTTDEMVYPLKMSSGNAGETELLLYLLADGPMIVEQEGKRQDFSIEKNLARYLDSHNIEYFDLQYGTYKKTTMAELPLTWEALDIATDIKLSVCKYKTVYTPEDMTDDLVFTCFKPIPYWKNRFFKEPYDNDWQKETDRKNAFMVLGWHDPHLLQEFSKDKYVKNRELAAMHPKTSEESLLELAKDDEGDVKYRLLNNRNLPVSVLRILAKNEDKDLRSRVAIHPNTSVEMLWEFARDKDSMVRGSTLHNHAINKEMLEFLSEDKDEGIRVSVAYNKKTPVELLAKLARDKSPHVRTSVAWQSNLPEELVEKLAHDKFAKVRRSIAFFQKPHVETLLMLSNDPNSIVRAAVAYNCLTPVEALRKLAKDTATDVRSTVAENHNTTEDILVYLADDDDYRVRYYVANNHSTPLKILTKLSKDKNPEVSNTTARYIFIHTAHNSSIC